MTCFAGLQSSDVSSSVINSQSFLVFGPCPAALPWISPSRSHISSAVTSVRVRHRTLTLVWAKGCPWKLPSPWPSSTAVSSFVEYDFREFGSDRFYFSVNKHFLILQVIFNGVSIMTLLIDAHMRISAIRFYLLSLVISGKQHFLYGLWRYTVRLIKMSLSKYIFYSGMKERRRLNQLEWLIYWEHMRSARNFNTEEDLSGCWRHC